MGLSPGQGRVRNLFRSSESTLLQTFIGHPVSSLCVQNTLRVMRENYVLMADQNGFTLIESSSPTLFSAMICWTCSSLTAQSLTLWQEEEDCGYSLWVKNFFFKPTIHSDTHTHTCAHTQTIIIININVNQTAVKTNLISTAMVVLAKRWLYIVIQSRWYYVYFYGSFQQKPNKHNTDLSHLP